MNSKLKIGDIIWIRSIDWPGSQYEHREVMGETSRSWLLYPANPKDWTRGVEYHAMRVPKTLRGFELGTELQAKRKLWAMKNAFAIHQKMEYLYDADVIIEIAKLLKYDVPEELDDVVTLVPSPKST